METLIETKSVERGKDGKLSPADLRNHANPAFARLAVFVEERNETAGAANYSRTHHRHNRSHTRR